MKKLSLFFTLLFSFTSSMAGEIIVRLNSSEIKDLPAELTLKPLIPQMNIYLLKDNKEGAFNAKTLTMLKSHSDIKDMMPNAPITWRSENPDDTRYPELWNLQLIQAPLAWAFGTSGKNSANEDVVVAVVDGGMDISHKDLVNNIWINTQEIPGNGIDDDNNGYVDDIYGWDAYNHSGKISNGRHGTHVAGIIGAQGNNALDITGVNWNIKIMAVAASSGTTATVLEGYGYVLAQKKLWLESNGKLGANVVATNSSFGVDRADCTEGDYVMWNDIYNEMGKYGILSAIATANRAWDIDKTGDVPTGCASDYIVAVTNTDSQDRINSSAGWGLTTIDIGAPGTDILSTLPNDKVGTMTGTSMATPHIAGAIGFLTSVASDNFTNLSKTDPSQAALELKNILLTTVDPVADLTGNTVSGGRLNLFQAASVISKF